MANYREEPVGTMTTTVSSESGVEGDMSVTLWVMANANTCAHESQTILHDSSEWDRGPSTVLLNPPDRGCFDRTHLLISICAYLYARHGLVMMRIMLRVTHSRRLAHAQFKKFAY